MLRLPNLRQPVKSGSQRPIQHRPDQKSHSAQQLRQPGVLEDRHQGHPGGLRGQGLHRGDEQNDHEQAQKDPPGRQGRDDDDTDAGQGHQHEVQDPRPLMAQLGGHGVLAADAITVDVAQIVGHQHRTGHRTDDTGRHPASRADVIGLDVHRAADGDQPEEDEDEGLPSPA